MVPCCIKSRLACRSGSVITAVNTGGVEPTYLYGQPLTPAADYPSKRGMSVLKVRQDAPDECSRRSWR